MKQGRLALRNRIVTALNSWEQLGCIAFAGPAPGYAREKYGKQKYFWRLVSGVAKDGRAVLIYPVRNRWDRVPRKVVRLMLELEGRGAIVGTAENIGDAWCIAAADTVEYKRAKKTFLHQYWHQRYQREKKKHERESE